jgi:hypothetical protein
MTLILSGTDGLSDVDGSAATPAIRGTDANTGIFFPSADVIAFSEGGVESARFNSSGNLQTIGTISVGNATPSTSGAGITFPASQSASSDANTLDDYEEGTWTPVDVSGAGLSFSNTSGNCFYTKIGRTVTATFRLTYPSTANGNAAVVGGLPFIAIDTTVNVQAICFGEQNFSAGVMGLVQDNNTTFLFLTTNGSSVTVHTNANVSTKDFRGTMTYQAV